MRRRLLMLGALVAVLVTAYLTGVLALVGDQERLATTLRDWGVWGYVLFLAVFMLLEPTVFPSIVFIVPATLVWSRPTAFALSLAGGLGASLIGFGFARYLARDWVAARMPARFRRYDDRLERNGLTTVILIRLVFFMAPPSHWVLGLSRVRFSEYLLGTAIGVVPGILALVYIGGSLVSWIGGQPPHVWAIATLAIVALATLWLLRRRARSGEPPA